MTKSRIIERHAGFNIERDEDGFFWRNGCYGGDGFRTIKECRADIDAFNEQEAEFYGDIDTPPDTPCLPAPWWSHV